MLLFRFESALSWPPVELQPAGAGGGGGQLSGRPATERSEGRWPRAQLHAARPPCTGSCHSVVVPTSGEGGGEGADLRHRGFNTTLNLNKYGRQCIFTRIRTSPF